MEHLRNTSGFEATLFAPVISDIEGPRFSESLLNAIWHSVAQIDHCSIFQFDPTERVRHITTASIVSLEGGMRSSERYADGLYAYDPMRAVLQESSEDEAVRVYQLQPQQIRERCYRRHFAELQTVDRISMLTRSDRNWYSLNLYRSKASGAFAQSELTRLQNAAPLLVALAKKHAQMKTMERKRLANEIEGYLQTILQPLSRQERSVCKLMLFGHKSKAIAEELGLRHNTVLTYRKRAYAKLNVSSQRELFGLCLTPHRSIESDVCDPPCARNVRR